MRPARWLRLALFCALTLPSVSCGAPFDSDKPHVLQAGGLELVSKSPEQQLLLFQQPDDVVKICLAPGPDAVGTFGEGINFGVKGESVGGDMEEGAGALGGRAPAVLLSRELFYRTCEFSLNYKLDKEEARDLFLRTMQSVERVVEHDLGRGSATLDLPAKPASSTDDDDEDDYDDDYEDDDD